MGAMLQTMPALIPTMNFPVAISLKFKIKV